MAGVALRRVSDTAINLTVDTSNLGLGTLLDFKRNGAEMLSIQTLAGTNMIFQFVDGLDEVQFAATDASFHFLDDVRCGANLEASSFTCNATANLNGDVNMGTGGNVFFAPASGAGLSMPWFDTSSALQVVSLLTAGQSIRVNAGETGFEAYDATGSGGLWTDSAGTTLSTNNIVQLSDTQTLQVQNISGLSGIVTALLDDVAGQFRIEVNGVPIIDAVESSTMTLLDPTNTMRVVIGDTNIQANNLQVMFAANAQQTGSHGGSLGTAAIVAAAPGLVYRVCGVAEVVTGATAGTLLVTVSGTGAGGAWSQSTAAVTVTAAHTLVPFNFICPTNQVNDLNFSTTFAGTAGPLDYTFSIIAERLY